MRLHSGEITWSVNTNNQLWKPVEVNFLQIFTIGDVGLCLLSHQLTQLTKVRGKKLIQNFFHEPEEVQRVKNIANANVNKAVAKGSTQMFYLVYMFT